MRPPMMLIALTLLCGACVETADAPDLASSGPPSIRDEIVRRHAHELATELNDRAPGSQAEQAASYYILGHLQRAGYVVRLDGVPVRNLVRSTNLMALPPSGTDPRVVVAAPYDTGADLTVAVWLELARAVHAAASGHSVEFVALGAERNEGLGSRRLARVLLDDDVDPVMVTMDVAASGEGDVLVEGDGPTAAALRSTAARLGLDEPTEVPPPSIDRGVFEQAGFEHVVVHGQSAAVGELLLEYLTAEGD